MDVIKNVFGTLHGKDIKAYTIKNDHRFELTCIEYGCVITSIKVPDRMGRIENVVLGFDSIEEYIKYSPYFGCVIGRIAGRIEGARFKLDGLLYTLAMNDGENNLHGGPHGFDQIIWDSSVKEQENEVEITFTHHSPDGHGGFPGNLKTTITYTVNQSNELIIAYHAISDRKTIVNLTNHTYFNLSGDLKRTILDHELTLNSDHFLELNSQSIPTGTAIRVDGMVFDFRQGQTVREGIRSNHQQIEIVGGGYDHPFLLNDHGQQEIIILDRVSGRKVEIETDEPCVVVYTGNSLSGDFTIRGRPSEKHLGLCLETQKPPNSMDSFIIEANQPYITTTKYAFGTIDS